MKKFYLSISLIIIGIYAIKAQYISEVLEYLPAPGQFINSSPWGVPNSANSIVGGLSGSMSLGVFGGYVIFKFENPVKNEEGNPYGIDFVIFGNPLENLSTPELNNNVTWAEPGIVCVMKDENNNGKPDDTWYELAGSDYFFSTTIKNYAVTYFNPGSETAADVLWSDNQGGSGAVLANSFHSQPYYPLSENFPDVNQTNYTLTGTKMKDYVDRTNPSYITAAGRPWGYVDNNLRNSYDGLPDNPYTDNIEEGSGGDAFDINWAIDANGNYADLDQIDFIKVYNGVLADAGWLGEVSTEITGAFDVGPAPSITGWDPVSVVLNNIPIQVSLGDTFLLESCFFINGRVQQIDNMYWAFSPTGKVALDNNNQITTVDTGKVTITANYNYKGQTYSNSMITTIISPTSVEISFDRSEIRVGEKYPVEAVVKDATGNKIPNLQFIWGTSNGNITIKEENDTAYIAGLKPGSAWIYVHPNGYSDIQDSLKITILEAAEYLNIYLTIKTNEETFIPRTQVSVSNFGLAPFVTDPYHNYGISDITNVTVAHAVSSVFDNESFESDLRFKDTENDGLYIYKLPVKMGLSVTNFYGYGNYEKGGNVSCWMVKTGNETYFKNLNDVILFADDELVAYYVTDINSNWKVYNLHTSANNIPVDETIELTLTSESFYMYSGTTVMSTGNSVVEGEKVLVNGEACIRDGENLVTNSEGKVELSFSKAGEYTIQLATELLNLVVNTGTNIRENNLNELSIYPNPANKSVKLKASNIYGNVQIKVYSQTGGLVLIRNFKTWADSHEINISTWNEGIYLVQVITSQSSVSKKIVVKH